jgi:hypothetical protein
MIDNRNDSNISGLLLIEVESTEVAERLAYLATNACNTKVELRPMH